MRASPRRYWLWAWLMAQPLILLAVFVSPLVFDPLFNKFEPLTAHHAALANRLEEVVARTGTNIPPERMFLMKASLKSNGLNAYVTGIGSTKRFVMWDMVTRPGAGRRNHVRLPATKAATTCSITSPKCLSMIAVALFFMFWACARFAEWMVRRFGPRWRIGSVAERAGFLTLLFAFSIANFSSLRLATP